MPQLDHTSYASQLFWLGIVFLLLYLGIAYYFAPRFKQLFQFREDKIEKKLALAKQLKHEAEILEKESKEKLDRVHQELYTLVHEAEIKSQQILLIRKHDISMFHSKALGEMQKELSDFRQSFFKSSKATEDLTKILCQQLIPFELSHTVYDAAFNRSKDSYHVA